MGSVVSLTDDLQQEDEFDSANCMLPTVQVGDHEIIVREFKGQRVVTFDLIDKLHNGKKNAARMNFSRNKHYFIEDVDYYVFKGQKGREALQMGNYNNMLELPGSNNFNFCLFTQTGYLMLVKSFNDELSWIVQRELVNNYFTQKLDNGNMFSVMRRMIDALEENQRALDENRQLIEQHNAEIENTNKRLDQIDEIHNVEVDPSWVTATKIAKKLKLYSNKGFPHASLVTALAAKAGLNVSRRTRHKDDYVSIIAKREGDTVIWEIYFTPLGEDAIIDWWHKNEKNVKFVELYKRKTGFFKPGDIRQIGYEIGRRRYEVQQRA